MPRPRQPRPERATKGSRSSRRRARDQAWVLARLMERFRRHAEILEALRRKSIDSGDLSFTPAKAPDLAAEGLEPVFGDKETISG